MIRKVLLQYCQRIINITYLCLTGNIVKEEVQAGCIVTVMFDIDFLVIFFITALQLLNRVDGTEIIMMSNITFFSKN